MTFRSKQVSALQTMPVLISLVNHSVKRLPLRYACNRGSCELTLPTSQWQSEVSKSFDANILPLSLCQVQMCSSIDKF
ncbi:hypothetical protein EG68_09312 [Paragonimus skrjabini miyazakii]|uniref:Uncharacterized protein n=1 Tax=Paragonimus skrjabini miyazakii TaxID=59628 RepID=A0A8S9YM97_9TREM|nr:hypothetical protein EG68_09312 [Paragonimus skrjabini miyazakii]